MSILFTAWGDSKFLPCTCFSSSWLNWISLSAPHCSSPELQVINFCCCVDEASRIISFLCWASTDGISGKLMAVGTIKCFCPFFLPYSFRHRISVLDSFGPVYYLGNIKFRVLWCGVLGDNRFWKGSLLLLAFWCSFAAYGSIVFVSLFNYHVDDGLMSMMATVCRRVTSFTLYMSTTVLDAENNQYECIPWIKNCSSLVITICFLIS